MRSFKIRWEHVGDGRVFVTDYLYDGCGNQEGYDIVGWCVECVLFGMHQGFRPIEAICEDYTEDEALRRREAGSLLKEEDPGHVQYWGSLTGERENQRKEEEGL